MNLPCLDICQPAPIAQSLLPCSRPLQTSFLEVLFFLVVQSRLKSRQ